MPQLSGIPPGSANVNGSAGGGRNIGKAEVCTLVSLPLVALAWQSLEQKSASHVVALSQDPAATPFL